MQSVSDSYTKNCQKNLRELAYEVKINWTGAGWIFETERVQQITIDRHVKTPLAGMHSAETTITLDNSSGRYLGNA